MRDKVNKALHGAVPAKRNQKVTVVVPDMTRPIDPDTVIAPLVDRLTEQGARVTILIALGLHRPMTEDELAPLSRLAIRVGATLLQHDPRSPDLERVTNDLGPEVSGLPGWVHPAVMSAERLITVGWVEPHQYAGFSGGIKTIAIGCAGAETIGGLHGLSLLRHPKTALGVVEGNPFQTALWRLLPHLPFVDTLLVVPTGLTEVEVFWGPVRATFAEAVRVARQTQFEIWPASHDAVSVSVPPVKAQNFYQASRAATYLALVQNSVVAEGGAVILTAACPEGLGRGTGEQAFVRALKRGRDVLEKELDSGNRALEGGEQRAFVLIRTLRRVRLALVGAPPLPELAPLGVIQADSVHDATHRLGLRKAPQTVQNVFRRVPVTA